MRIYRICNLTLMQILSKLLKKANKRIYYIFRMIKIKSNPIILEKQYFHKFNSKCNFLYNIVDKEKFKEKLYEYSLSINIITSADNICNHKFDLLGSGKKYLGKDLSWNKDFKTGYVWKNGFYKNIKIVNLSNNSDVKVPWELSRFQHIITLGKAYWITDNEKYAIEFKNEITNWIQNNPVEMSVNWTCTMDVAIRAVNLICGYFFFTKSKNIDNDFWVEFNKSLYLHGKFIYRNLENEGQHNGNHYLSDLCGLIWLGIYFNNFIMEDKKVKNNPKAWLEFGISEFKNEMKNEVNLDGTDYEASTSYHRLVTELFLITTILCNKNDIYFSDEYMQKLEKMCEFMMNIIKPNGLSPIIGDEDDGRLLIVSNYGNWNRRDFRHVLAAAGEYFDRDDFRYFGRDYREDALWITGNFKESGEVPSLNSKAYDKGGYYILRNDRIYCIIRCGELSCSGEGGHSHNDQLSIELNVDNEDFIVDPGTYVYTSNYKMRNLFRSTGMHNTLQVGSYEQNDFNKYDLFYMKEQSFAKCVIFNESTFSGEHYGYKRKCGVIHRRTVKLRNNGMIIEDNVLPDKINDDIYVNFILDCDVDIIRRENGIDLIKNNKSIFMKFHNPYLITDTYVSYGYGQKFKTKKLSIMLKKDYNKVELICC
ncbi:heparinase II/III family protein [Clostridium sp. WLY-B-L2]|uniref:Heparinase II/III family protein n=1 Tax=Clostridium aromativorans TaxID=2836848 RepID=A0ABS8N950_9CLOT|nr:alginate lyase family protein [Clostridium aromativorans]MCC9296346.1 heparinase II/III family protein [Clostridium aromativorans]